MFFIFPQKSIIVSDNIEDFRITKGLLHPSLVRLDYAGGSKLVYCNLRPMYRNHEEEVANKMGISPEVHKLAVTIRLKDAWKWIKDQFSEEKMIESKSL